jgi:hypothetical protein
VGAEAVFTYDQASNTLRVQNLNIWDGTNEFFQLRSTNKYNTFAGYNAGLAHTTLASAVGGVNDGTSNTGFGYSVMEFATNDCWYNTGVGTHALNGITTGNMNSALGANAMLGMQTGSTNVAIGQSALRSATASDMNTAVGYSAMYNAVNAADGNGAIGAEALYKVDGDGNNALGQRAGYELTTGSWNVLLGHGAGVSVDSKPHLVTGSGNIIIGTYATPTSTSAAGECIFGSEYTPITNVYIGKGGSHASPAAVTIQNTTAFGTNIAGANVSLAGGKGTGTGAGGSVKIQVAPAGSTGSTPNSLVDVIVVDSTQKATYGGFEIGYREIPQNAQTANYTCVLSDSGKHIYHASGAGAGDTYTIPANASVAYPIGATLTFINDDTNSVSIAITTDTLVLAGTGATGTRTLASNGRAVAIKVGTTRWQIDGTGLT